MIGLSNVATEPLLLDRLPEKACQADVLRLDKIHPVVSGNKWFKLKYYLEHATNLNKKALLTFGGAYSNHIIATAFAAKENGFKAIGIIRGEATTPLSPTLQAARDYGMELNFMPRDIYKRKNEEEVINTITDKWGDIYIIPEGGDGELGRKGAAEILLVADLQKYSHIICAVGTGTTFIGIVNASLPGQEVIGIPVLKGMQNLDKQYTAFIKDNSKKKYTLFYDYHLGGYAKKTQELLEFMNIIYKQTGIPTDFVYTGKLMYALDDLLRSDHFKPGSHILFIHSGGLQGNNSLAGGVLLF